MMLANDRVISLASEARDWAEQVAQKENFPKNLCGLCARASAHLHQLLVYAGIQSELVFITGHCFLRVTLEKERYVLDITATQFGKPRIFSTSWNLRDDLWRRRPYRVYKSLKYAAEWTQRHWHPFCSLDRCECIKLESREVS